MSRGLAPMSREMAPMSREMAPMSREMEPMFREMAPMSREMSPRFMEEMNIIPMKDQNPELLYCTSPYNSSDTTKQQRIKSCSLGGLKDSAPGKILPYDNLQNCVGDCRLGKRNPKSKRSCNVRNMNWVKSKHRKSYCRKNGKRSVK
jgi:hypothetical protein